ncbi:MAG: biotin/lipoyl-containing protein, partial [Brevundimonas sp.]
MTTEVRVPTLGESVSEATVAHWYKRVGDRVAADEMLCELETDKVTVEVPAPVAGIITEIVVAEGTTIGVAALLAQIAEGDAAPAVGKAEAAEGGAGEVKMTDVMVPALGESVSEATVSTWFKKVGDAVAQDEMLCELETDKVSVEVPSPVAGVLAEILAPEGTTVAASARLAIVSEGAAATTAPTAARTDPQAVAAEAVASPGAGPETLTPRVDVEDAPAAKKAMAEAGLTRDQVQGTGRDGRVMKEDVAAAAKPAAPAPAAPAQAAAAPIPRAPVPADDAAREERVKMTRLRQTIARRL